LFTAAQAKIHGVLSKQPEAIIRKIKYTQQHLKLKQ